MTDNPSSGVNMGSAHGAISIDVAGLLAAQRQVERASKAMTAALSGVEKGVKRTEESVNKLKISGEGLSAAGGLLNRLGLPGGQGLQTAGQAINAARGLKQLDDQLKPFVANLAKSSGIIGGLVDKGGGLISSLTGFGSGIAGVAAVALPAVAIIGGVAAGIALLNRHMEEEATRLKAVYDARVEFAKDTARLDSEQAKKKLEDEKKNVEQFNKQIESGQKVIQEKIEKELPSMAVRIGNNMKEALEGNLPAVREFPALKSLFDDLDKLKGQATTSQNTVALLTQGLKDGAFATNDAAKAEENLRKTRLAAIGNFLEGVAKSFADSSKARAELIAKTLEFNEETKRIDAQRQLAAKRDDEDFERKRAQDRADFAKQQTGAETSYQRDRAKRIADFNASNIEQESKANQERLKTIQEHSEEAARSLEDHQRRLAQIEREGRESVLEAASRLDARGVFEALRATREKRNAENEEFQVERRRRNQDLSARLQDLTQHTAVERQQRAAAFAQELAESDTRHKQQQAAEKATFDERISREDQQRAIERQRRIEDFAIADRERRASFDRQVQDLRDRLLKPEEIIKQTSYGIQLMLAGKFVQGINAIFAGFKLPQLPVPTAPSPNAPTGPGVPMYSSPAGPPAPSYNLPAPSTVSPVKWSYGSPVTPTRHVGGAGRAGGASWTNLGDWTHPGEAVASRPVADKLREILGSGFSQGELAAFVAGRSGGGSLTVPVTVTALPGMSPHDIAQLVAAEVEPAIQRVMEGDH